MSETVTIKARLRAPIERVHRALTDAGELTTWLAEHAEVDLPHTYAFWGRYTPEGDAPHQRPLHIDDRTIRLGWLIDGHDTTVDIALAEQDGETVVELSQSHFPGWQVAMEETNIRGVLYTFWAVSIANLADHLEGRELGPKADFTSPEMRGEVLIDGKQADVFDALLDQEKFTRWFGARVGIEPYLGGRWAMGGLANDTSPAKILELDQDRKMAIGWSDGQVTTWELAESAGRTRLTFTHSGFDEGHPPYGAWTGWLSGFAELRRFVEQGADWRPMWLDV